jgi:hypothetical protein
MSYYRTVGLIGRVGIWIDRERERGLRLGSYIYLSSYSYISIAFRGFLKAQDP